ncbi:hypothetical protein SAMN05519104_6914 [Rhizobiales bacterium GAS188]|nr:hypothetical protein SAMN05519104_6914 [Rhizobiales bacterium GAS188]
MAHAKSAREVKESHDCRIAETAFEIADILLCHARNLSELLLSEPFFPSQPRKVTADQPAHVHARNLTSYTL